MSDTKLFDDLESAKSSTTCSVCGRTAGALACNGWNDSSGKWHEPPESGIRIARFGANKFLNCHHDLLMQAFIKSSDVLFDLVSWLYMGNDIEDFDVGDKLERSKSLKICDFSGAVLGENDYQIDDERNPYVEIYRFGQLRISKSSLVGFYSELMKWSDQAIKLIMKQAKAQAAEADLFLKKAEKAKIYLEEIIVYR